MVCPSASSADKALCFPTGQAVQHSLFPTAQSAGLGGASSHRRPPRNPSLWAATSGWAPPSAAPPLQVALYSCREHLHSPGGRAWAALVWLRAPASPRAVPQIGRDPPGRQEGGRGRCVPGAWRGQRAPASAWGPSQNCPEDLPVLSGRPKRRDDAPESPAGLA